MTELVDQSVDWITAAEGVTLWFAGVACAAIIVAAWLASRLATCPRRCARCADLKVANAALLEALESARYRPDARTVPHPVHVSQEPAQKRPERLQRPAWLGWPGTTPMQLPLIYGRQPLDPGRLEDPCLRPPAPADDDLREWILTDRLIDTVGGVHGWSIPALPPPVHPRSPFTTAVVTTFPLPAAGETTAVTA